jgi:hypothetical protein
MKNHEVGKWANEKLMDTVWEDALQNKVEDTNEQTQRKSEKTMRTVPGGRQT